MVRAAPQIKDSAVHPIIVKTREVETVYIVNMNKIAALRTVAVDSRRLVFKEFNNKSARYGRNLSSEDIRQIRENLSGFLEVLNRCEKAVISAGHRVVVFRSASLIKVV